MSTKERVIQYYTRKISDLEAQIQEIETEIAINQGAKDALLTQTKTTINEKQKNQNASKIEEYTNLLETLKTAQLKTATAKAQLETAKAMLSGGRRIKKTKRVQRKRQTKRTRKH